MKKAHYYPEKSRLTYFITDLAQLSRSGLTFAEAQNIIQEQALGPKEIVQVLTVIPNSKI